MTGLPDPILDPAAASSPLAEEARQQSGSYADSLAAGGDTVGYAAVEAVSAVAHGAEAAASSIGETVMAVIGGLFEGLGS